MWAGLGRAVSQSVQDTQAAKGPTKLDYRLLFDNRDMTQQG